MRIRINIPVKLIAIPFAYRRDAPRQEMVYNIKEKPFIASIRVGSHKLIWGSKTSKVCLVIPPLSSRS